MAIHGVVNIVIHRDRRSLVAPAEAGNVTNANFFRVGALKGRVKGGANLVTSAKMAAHVRTDAHVHLWRRAEMKVRIKAGYRVDLTDRDVDGFSKRFEPVGWQVPEIALYRPQLFKHDSRHSA
jgi:hypothetical protein